MLLYLGEGHKTLNSVAIEVSTYMVRNPWSPIRPQSLQGSMANCLMSVREMKSDGARG